LNLGIEEVDKARTPDPWDRCFCIFSDDKETRDWFRGMKLLKEWIY
jgi:hypothetical protein